MALEKSTPAAPEAPPLTIEAIKEQIERLPPAEQLRLLALLVNKPQNNLIGQFIGATNHHHYVVMTELERKIKNAPGNYASEEDDKALIEFRRTHSLSETAEYLGNPPDLNGIEATKKAVKRAKKRVQKRAAATKSVYRPPS